MSCSRHLCIACRHDSPSTLRVAPVCTSTARRRGRDAAADSQALESHNIVSEQFFPTVLSAQRWRLLPHERRALKRAMPARTRRASGAAARRARALLRPCALGPDAANAPAGISTSARSNAALRTCSRSPAPAASLVSDMRSVLVRRISADSRATCVSVGCGCGMLCSGVLRCALGAAVSSAAVTSSAAAADPPRQPPHQRRPKRPPLPNRVNEVMPAWLRVRGEFRERVEGFVNSGFVDGRDDLYYLSRFRFNATRDGQDDRRHGPGAGRARRRTRPSVPTGTPFTAPFDLRQAFVDLGSGRRPGRRRGSGRQELAFGDQRLVGHANWLNCGAHFRRARG